MGQVVRHSRRIEGAHGYGGQHPPYPSDAGALYGLYVKDTESGQQVSLWRSIDGGYSWELQDEQDIAGKPQEDWETTESNGYLCVYADKHFLLYSTVNAANGVSIVERMSTSESQVYSIDGRMLNGKADLSGLPRGIYVVKSGGKARKVAVK